MKKNNTFSTTYANYEQNLAISQGVHISHANYAKVNHSPIVTSICGTSGTSCPNALASSFAFSSGSSLFLSGYNPHSSAYIPLSSAGLYYQFASACRTKGGKYLAAGLMAASFLQGIMVPYALAATTYDVNNGQTVTGIILDLGDRQNVNDGGTANSITMNAGGSQAVLSGGIANDATVNFGGRQDVSSGGIANATTVYSDGQQFVSNGSIISGTIVNSGGQQHFFGATATQNVSGNTLNSGATQVFAFNAVASGLVGGTVQSGITQVIELGGSASNVYVSSGGNQHVSNGGTISGTTVNAHGVQVFDGATATHNVTSNTLNSGASQVFQRGAVALGSVGGTVDDGITQVIMDGGSAVNVAVSSGGSQLVLTSGIVSGTTVNSGGTQLFDGATATHNVTSNTLNSGASQVFQRGAVALGSVGGTVDDGITQVIADGGSAVGVTVNNGGTQYVSNGGTANSTTINNFGSQHVSNGGIANYTTINSLGNQHVSNGGMANDTLISGGQQVVLNGGTASGTTINGGSQYVSNGGTASGTIVNNSGRQIVLNGGMVSGTTVNSGGQQDFLGVTATNNVTNNNLISGATQAFAFGAVASDSVGGTVKNGITQIINYGGSAVDVTVSSGGSQNIYNGGTASGTILHAGGTQAIFNGGTITGDMTYGTGQVLRAQGGNFTGNLAFNGGTFVPVLDPALPNNHINVAGEVTGMAGGTIAPVWYNDQAGTGEETYTVLSAGVALTDTFGTQVDLVKATYTQEISGNELLLKVVEKNAVYQGYSNYLSSNGQNLAVILDTIDANGQLPKLMTALGNLPADGEVVAAAIQQLVPESFSTANALNQSIIRAFMAQRPTMAEGTLRVGEDAKPLTASKTSGLPAGSALKQNAWQFFGSPFGFTATQQSTDDFSGYDMTAAGVNLGIMRSFDNYWLGASLGYSSQYLKMKDMDAKIDSDQLMFSVFGGVRYNDFFAEAALGYAHTWNDSSRNINIGAGPTAYNDTLTANYGQNSFLASLTLGYLFEFDNNFRIIPSVGVDYVHTHSNAFDESGGNGALGIDAGSFYSLQIPVSITLEKSFMANEAIITPSLTVSWIPELGDSYATTNAHFVNAGSAGSFETESMESDRHTFAFGAGLDMQFNEDFGVNVNYGLNTRSQYTSHSVDVNFKWEF